MKTYILDIQDGNGCQLLTFFDQDAALSRARDWMTSRSRLGDAASESNINDNMDELYDGNVVKFIDASIHLGESDLDLSGIVEVLADALHTMAQNQNLLKILAESAKVNIADGLERANSRYLATEQAVHHTLKKLKGRS